jgi:hypothetical protein
MDMTDVERRALKAGAAPMEPIAVRLPEATRISGLSKSEIYRGARRGEIILLKNGRSTLVVVNSLRSTLEKLPRAVLRRTQEQENCP